VAALGAKRVVQLVMNGDPPHELLFRHGPQMRPGNQRFGSPIRVGQLLGHERGEVLFDGLEVASEPPG
jgi:hypothetical protein